MRMRYVIGTLFACTLIHIGSASARSTDVEVPDQLIGHCLEGDGQGSLEVDPSSSGDQFVYRCTFTAITQGELGGNNIDSLGLNWEKASSFGGAAYLRGYIGQGYGRENGRYVGRIDIVLHVFCGAYGDKVCRLDDVLAKAHELGDFSKTKVRLVSNISNGAGNPSSVCISPGPGYPNGPSCYRYAPVAKFHPRGTT